MPDRHSSDTDRFSRAVRELQQPVHGDDFAIQRIMQSVRRQRIVRSSLTRTVLAAALATALATAAVWRFGASRAPQEPLTNSEPTFVQFVYIGPQAEAVSLVGSFNDWDPQANPLRQDRTQGVWTAEIPLKRGHHEYAFNVDGRWVPDDDAPLGASDEFGVANSVILVQ